ncbi:hypothetical protein FPHYL_11569 [Fusarium phyllophilum]|uniref:Uncharacterized protein n=1 Tax=Fusarium phyllophilum TaxID=47803 RepID=A0A8H5IRZ6_9HYPO|nr:hypothetical protein FPHYL_11569 [Fusarium phyllophilum]
MAVAQTHAFANTGTLRNHYREQHEKILRFRQSGGNKRALQDDLIRWYSFLLVEPAITGLPGRPSTVAFPLNLNPGQAFNRFYQLVRLRPFTALELVRRATSSRRPSHDQEAETEEVENKEYDSATDFEGFQDLLDNTTAEDNADTESAATAAAKSTASKSDAAPLRTEDKVETSPSEHRAARREKQKAMRTPTNTSHGRVRGGLGRSGSGSLGYLPTPRSNDSNAGSSVYLYGINSYLPDEGGLRSPVTQGIKIAPSKNNNNKNDQPEILGAVSKGGTRFNSQAASLAGKRGQSLVAEQSSVTKKSRNAREVFDKDTVVLHPRGLAHQVILSETQCLNQATLTQILAEGQATNARMDARETSMAPKAIMRPPNQGAKFAQELQDLRFTSSEQRLSTAEKKVETMWSYMSAMSQSEEKEKTQEVEVEKDNEMTDHAIAGNSTPKASPDAAVTYALSSEDEFPGLDVRDLDEFDFE